jgi:catechol 2,3-dioxygenase-like lactoylglutathione lyase family enzyme
MTMLDHVSLGCSDLQQSTAFFATALAPLGYRVHKSDEQETALGLPEQWMLFLYPASDPARALVGDRMHVALGADSRAQVHAAFDAARAAGARPVPDREPAERPQFGEDYFGGVFLDPDGHMIEVLTRAS